MSRETPSRARGWRNRIIGYDEADPEQLLANPSNWRIHPQFQQEALEGALGEIGWLSEIIVNKRTSVEWPDSDRGVETVLDGHLRVKLALRFGERKVPVAYVDLTPQEEALALATFDPLSALAVPDAELLAETLNRAYTEDEALGQLLDELAQLVGAERERKSDEAEEDTGIVTFEVRVPSSLTAEFVSTLETFKHLGLRWSTRD